MHLSAEKLLHNLRVETAGLQVLSFRIQSHGEREAHLSLHERVPRHRAGREDNKKILQGTATATESFRRVVLGNTVEPCENRTPILEANSEWKELKKEKVLYYLVWPKYAMSGCGVATYDRKRRDCQHSQTVR